MAIIELNLEKPALKRTESDTVETDDDDGDTGSDESETGGDSSRPGSGSRFGSAATVLGVIAVGLIAVMTIKKLRSRRSSSDDDLDFEG